MPKPRKPGRPPKRPTQVIHIRLPREIARRIEAMAEEFGTTPSALGQIALTMLLKVGLKMPKTPELPATREPTANSEQ